MKKIIAVLLLSLSVSNAISAASDLVGSWESHERTNVLSPGVMIFESTGSATLAPEGFEAMTGSFTSDNKFIDITIPGQGKAALAYSLKKNTLRIEYENGSVQNFIKKITPTQIPTSTSKLKDKK